MNRKYRKEEGKKRRLNERRKISRDVISNRAGKYRKYHLAALERLLFAIPEVHP